MKVVGVFVNANEVQEFSSGATIFSEGDEGHQMYGVIDGEIQLKDQYGWELRIGADDIFGEMALIEKNPRSATATALTDVKLAVLDERRFLFLVQETPMFALQVMHTLSQRMRRGMH